MHSYKADLSRLTDIEIMFTKHEFTILSNLLEKPRTPFELSKVKWLFAFETPSYSKKLNVDFSQRSSGSSCATINLRWTGGRDSASP